MSAYLILIGAADLVGRTPLPLNVARESLGLKPSDLIIARTARDAVIRQGADLAVRAYVGDPRARTMLHRGLLEAAARLNDRSRCR